MFVGLLRTGSSTEPTLADSANSQARLRLTMRVISRSEFLPSLHCDSSKRTELIRLLYATVVST
jgi:hypothetical protein